jgi:hypothetical protein
MLKRVGTTCGMRNPTDRVNVDGIAKELGGRRRNNVVRPILVLCMGCPNGRMMTHLASSTLL